MTRVIYKKIMAPVAGSLDMKRHCIVALEGDESEPVRVIGSIQLEVHGGGLPYMVAWIEVLPDFLRQGHGRGLVEAMERWVGEPIHMEAATPEGQAFCGAMQRRADQ